MEKKIIELTKCNPNDGHSCIICSNPHATTKVNIQRLINIRNDSLIIFFVCDECVAKMQKDIEVCE
jgi:hypothetical protein